MLNPNTGGGGVSVVVEGVGVLSDPPFVLSLFLQLQANTISHDRKIEARKFTSRGGMIFVFM